MRKRRLKRLREKYAGLALMVLLDHQLRNIDSNENYEKLCIKAAMIGNCMAENIKEMYQ